MSYTTRDEYINRELLQEINLIVSSWGDCYIDLLHNESKDKQKHVKFMLSTSDILILVNSESILKSEWVMWELKEARKQLIPIIKIDIKSDIYECKGRLIKELNSRLECSVSHAM